MWELLAGNRTAVLSQHGCYMLLPFAPRVYSLLVSTPCCICVLLGVTAQSFKTVKLLATPRLACLGSVSNRVIARKLERKRKIKRCKREGEGRRGSFFPLPLPRHSFFLLSFSTNSRGNACYAGYSAAVHRRYRSAGTPTRRRKHGDLFSWRAKN